MDEIDFLQAAECLKTIAHPVRLAMIHYLLQRGSASVGDIAKFCKLKSHVVSEHLTLLKDRGFFESKRVVLNVFYSIKETALENIMNCIRKKFIIGGNKHAS